MCSICGGNYPLELVRKASQTMVHRGPDFSGEFSDGVVALAHNRLSIIDLDSEANQPFTSPFCPHLVLVFNGEIYNYLEIKQELTKLGIPFLRKVIRKFCCTHLHILEKNALKNSMEILHFVFWINAIAACF